MEFSWKIEIFRGVWSKIDGFGVLWLKREVLVEKSRFFEKWGFRGFLVNKSGKSRKEPGI